MLPKTGKKRCHIGGYLAAEQKIKSCCQKKKIVVSKTNHSRCVGVPVHCGISAEFRRHDRCQAFCDFKYVQNTEVCAILLRK